MPVGRPTKYSKAREAAICKLLKAGCTRMASAESLGISYDTFRNWCANNSDFFVAVTRAEAEAEALFTQVMIQHAVGTKDIPSDWRAAESWLKRRRRAEWGDSIDIRKLDDDTLLRLLALEAGGDAERVEDTGAG